MVSLELTNLFNNLPKLDLNNAINFESFEN